MANQPRKRSFRLVVLFLLLSVLWTSLGFPAAVHAQDGQPPLDTEEIRIVGLEIQPSPATLVVPKNTGTIVTPLLIRSDGVTGETPALPADAFFVAELRGPAFRTPVPISAPLNGSFPIPPLALPGNYTLEQIRLVHNGETLITSDPSIVTIEVIDRVLETQVTVTPLTAEQIQQRGIFIDQTNFQVVNFTVAFGLENNEVKIDFPMILPKKNDAGLPGIPTLQMPAFSVGRVSNAVPVPALEVALKSPNIEVTGFSLAVPEDQEPNKFNLPPIPGVVIIPGNIGYLNQFFSVMLKVSNAAPGYSNLVVKDLKAEIILPTGGDTVIGTSDDPLRMARLGNPPVTQPKILPVVGMGADKILGTADDVLDLAPQTNADAEFLVEGLREGAHRLNFKITGMLHGLPSGPLPIEGTAVGMVEVRNPRFSITLHHPETITAGELYDFMVTVTNISETPANFVSLSLLPNSISGALLKSPSTQSINTIEPGDSATVVYQLEAQKTGTVTSNSIAADGIPGKFELYTAVGELGIPMSPNVLLLPKEAKELPGDLYNVGIGLLGQAYAVATAPFPPKGLLPISRDTVYERAIDLAAAGQRLEMGEALGSVARDIALDFLGNNYARIDSQYAGQGAARIDRMKAGFTGFDTLLRQSRRGAQFMNILAGILNQEASANGLLTFQQRFAEAAASRPAHLSIIVGNDGGTAPVTLSVVDALGKRLGIATGGETQREIPFANYFPLQSTPAGTSALALLASPQNGRHVVEVTGTGDGVFDLGVVAPAGGGLQRVTFENVAITVGAKATLVINVGGSDPFELRIDDNGDGAVDRAIAGAAQPVVDRGPQLVASTQVFIANPITHPSKYGLLIAALFSEEVELTSAEHNGELDAVTRYFVDNNRVRSAFVQPRGRVVTMWLRDGIGPFVDRSLTVTEIKDIKLNSMATVSETVAIRTVKETVDGPRRIVPGIAGQVNGTVRRADGTPVPNARIYMSQRELDINDEPYWVLVTVKDANPDGTYSLDYVRNQSTKWEFLDPETNERGSTGAQPSFDGHEMALDLILRGRGTLTGKVTNSSGQPLAEAFVRANSITNIGLGDETNFIAKTNAEGNYVLSGVPVGTLSLTAVHPRSNAQVKATAAITEPGSTVVQNLTLLSLDFPQNFGNLQGQVFRADGVTPAPNVPVYTTLGGTAVTDASGSYRIENLPVGEALIRAIDQEQLQEATIRTNIVASDTVTANLLLFGGTATIRGSVRDSDGNALPGISIYGGFSVITSNERGEFVMTNLPLGNRQVSAFDSAGAQLVSANVTLTRPGEEAVVQLVFPVRGTLTGRVFRADGVTPVPNLKLFALGPKNEVGFTDQNGNYRFENMPKGDYTISAFFTDWSDGNVVKSKIVFKDETRVVNVIFRGRGTVTGTIFDDDGVTPLGALVAISEWEPKIGQLIPKENPLCLSDIDLGGGEKLDLPDCENVAVDWKYTLRRRYVNSSVESGQFTFPNTFVGNFVVEAANPFSPQIVSTGAEIPAPNATRAVTLSLQSTGVVSGVVLLPDGTPATGRVLVRAQVGSVTEPIVVTTDSNGRFIFPLMPAVPFILSAEEDYGNRLVGRAAGQVKAGDVLELPIRLLRTGSVTVTVQGAGATPGTFQPVPGAQVTLSEGAFTRRVIVKNADANGVAVFSGGDVIREGGFSVNAVSNGVRGFAGGTLLNVTQDPAGSVAVTVTLRNEAASISGRFLRTNGTTGIPNAQIILRAAGETIYATTGVTGTYRFDGVPAGFYTLEGFDPVTGRRGRATGQVTTADHNRVLTTNMIQAALGNVNGSVRLDADNAPVVGAEVILSIQGSFPASLYATTDSNGLFQFTNVPAGPFNVSARDYITGLDAQISGTLSNEGETANAEIRLTRQPTGSVTGVVTGTVGSPATGARVSLLMLPERGSMQTTVDSQGRYTFTNVLLGGVRVIATPQLGGDQAEGVGEVSTAGDVEVINLGFRGVATVDGTVLGWQGSAAAGTEVTLTRKDKLPPYYNRTTTTDSNGFFRFERVPLGQFDVTANQRFQQLGGSAAISITIPDATTVITVALEPAGTISGTVRRQDGSTVAAQMAVELTSADGKVTRYGSTDAGGNFSFADLKLTSYSLLISDPLGVGYVNASTTLTTAGQIRDLGVLRLDDAPPAVLSITPANGAIRVPVTQTIGVNFSEPVQASTITNTNLVVSTAAGVVTGTWTLNAEQTQATFTPNVRFRDFTGVSVRVRTGIKDRVGRSLSGETVSSFTTTDATPPSFVTRSPAPNSQGAPVNGVIRVQWSEALDISRFSGSVITLTLNGVPVTPARPVEFLQNNTVAVFTPLDILESDSVYQVTVEAATDLFGNRQAAPAVYTFRTQDLISPVLSALGLQSGAVLRTGESAIFTPTLDTTADVAQVEYFVDGAPRFVAVSAPFTFSLPVSVTQAVTTTVAARATDFSGNRSEQRSVVLDLRPDVAPQVTILEPVAGSTVRNGERVTMTVRYEDDFALSRVLYQARGVVGTGNTVNLPAGTSVYTGSFSVVVPSTATPGSALILETSAVDNANRASAIRSVSLTVADAAAPSVQFLSPANNSAVDAGSTVSVTLRANDNGRISAIGLNATGAATFTETRTLTPTVSSATVTFAVPVSATAAPTETITLVAVAQDEAGNRSNVATWTLRIRDAVAPQVTISAAPATVIAGTSLTVSVSAVDAVGLSRISLVAAGGVSQTQSVNLSGSPAGAARDFTVSVPVTVTAGSVITLTGTATDGGNNVGSSAPVTVTVLGDSAPSAAITAPAEGSSIATGKPVTVSVQVSDDVGVARVELVTSGIVTAAQAVTLTPAAITRTVTFTVNVPADAALGGSLVLTATAVDTQAQRGNSAARVLVVGEDQSAPTVQIVTPANQAQMNPGETFTVTVAAADNVGVSAVDFNVSGVVSFTRNTPVNSAQAVSVTLPVTVPASAIGSDVIVVAVSAVDAGGNRSAVQQISVRVRDLIAPQVTLDLRGRSEVIRGQTITATVVATDEVGLSSLRLVAGGVISETQNITIFPTQPRATNAFVVSVPVTVTDNSTFTLTASAVDGAGNTSAGQPVTITVVDDLAPLVRIDAPAQVGSGEALTVTLSAEDDQGVAALRFNAAGAVVTATTRTITPATTLYTETVVLTVPAGATPGTLITLSATVTDTRNQARSATPVTVTVADLTRPTAQVTSHANGSNVDPGVQTNFTVRATDNGLVNRVDFAIDGAFTFTASREISPAVAAINVSFPVTIPLAVAANSTLTLTAIATDTAGNVSQPWISTVKVADVIDPEISASLVSTEGVGAEVVRGRSFTVTLTATDNAGVGTLFLRTTGAVTGNQSATISPAQTPVTRTFSVAVPVDVALGSLITVTAEARDAAQNQGFSTPFTLTVVESAAQLSGVVRNSGGEPVGGARVFVQAANGTFITTSAEDGVYTLSGLADGFIAVDVRDTVGIRAGRAVGTLSGDAGLTLDVTLVDGVLAQSRFDDDAEGWTTAGGFLSWLSGLDYIAIQDQSAATVFYFEAPAKFLGDLSAAYGSILSFDLRRSSSAAVNSEADVILVGEGLTLYYRTNRVPTANFQTYTLPLDLSTTAWTVGSPTGPAATEAEFQAVLANLQALRIRGDYVNGNGYGYLDNVTMRTATTRLYGALTNAANQPLPSNAMTVTAASGVYAVATDANGEYLLPGITTGAVNVTAIGPDGLRRTVTGNLAAGQTELLLNVKIAAAPAVTITNPVSGTTVLEGATIPVTATATAEFGIARVIFLVNGSAVFTDTAAPFRTDVTVPLDVTGLTLAARAEDVDGNATTAQSIITVGADDNTTVTGRVLDATNGNAPVEGATITLNNGLTATSGVDGLFTIANVPTAQGTIQAIARATIGDRPLQAIATAQPVPGGVTNLGDMLLMVTKFWDGGGNNSNWQTAANWNGDTLPTATDDVYIPVTATVTLNSGAATINSLYSDGVLSIGGGALSVAAQSTVYSVTVTSGTWSGAGDVTVTGELRWSGGTLSGTGSTILAGTARLDGSSTRNLDGRTLENRGTLVWSSNNLNGYNGARLVNTAAGVIDLQSSADYYWQNGYGARPIFENAGTVIRSAAAADSLNIHATLINSGTVDVRTGTLALYGGGSATGTPAGGDFNVEAGATLRFDSNYAVTDADIRGAGTTQFNTGTLTVNGVYSGTAATRIETGATLLVNGAATLGEVSQINGTLTGSGVITVSGLYTWSAGTVSGSGTLIAGGGLRIESTSGRILDGRTLENRGSAVWTAGTVNGYNGARLINAAGATFETQTNADFYWQESYGARPFFENNGTLITTGGTTSDPAIVYAQFINRGAVTVQSGVLRLEGTGSSSGSIAVAGGATLRFRSNFTLESASSVSGAGTVDFNSGTVTLNGGYAISGTTQVSGGSFIVGPAANVQNIGALVNVSSGTLNLTSVSLTTPALEQSNGVITGTGMLTVSNVFTWTGGDMSGSGATILLGNGSISGSTSRGLDLRTLENRGSLIWSAANINGYNAARIVNAAGATFEIRTDADFYWQDSYGARPSFENAGTLIKSVSVGGSEATLIYNRFVNSGVVQVQAGALTLLGGGEGGGSVNVAAGAVLRSSSSYTWTNLTVTGAGALEHTSSTLAVSGGYSNTATTRITGGTLVISPTTAFTTANLSISGGALTLNGDALVSNAFTWSGGEINGTGRLIAAQSMVIEGSSSKSLSAVTLENRNSTLWTGGDVNSYAGAQFVNVAGATFNIQTVDDIYWQSSYGTRPIFVNRGTLIKAGGGVDRTEIYATFNNLGSTVVQTQTLDLVGGGVNNGSLNIAGGASLRIGTDYTLGAGTAVGGAGQIEVAAGTLNVATGAAFTLPNLLLNGGTLAGSDGITVNNFTWRSGTVSGSGILRTDGATLLDNNTSRTLTARTWENTGNVTWLAGFVTFQSGGTLNNLATGVVEIRTDGTPITFSGNRPVLTNAGTIAKRAGAGTTVISHIVNNSGVVRAETGILSLIGGGDSTGVFEALPGARVEFNGQTHNLSAGSTLRGEIIRFASGTVNIGGTLNITGTTDMAGGTVTVSNTATVQNLGTLLSITGGAFNLNHGQPSTLSSLGLAGTLSGNSAITVTGPFTWSSGTVGGSGILRTAGATLLDNNTSRVLSGRTWENPSTVTWQAGFVSFQNGGTLNNLATGVINLRTDGTPVTFSGTRPVLTNAGTIVKAAGAGDTEINHVMNNSGVVRAESGILSLSGGGQNSGVIEAVPGARIEFESQTHNLSAGSTLRGEIIRFASGTVNIGGTLNVTGTTEVAGGTVTVSNTATVQNLGTLLSISGGTFNLNHGQPSTLSSLALAGTLSSNSAITVTGSFTWSSGTVGGSGVLRTAGATLLDNNTSRALSGRIWENAGNVTWQAGFVSFQNGSTLNNLATGVVDIRTDGTPLTFTGTRPVLTNAGTLIKNTGSGSMTINHDVVNSGVVRVEGGVLAVNNFTQAAGGRLTVAVAGNSTATGLGSLSTSATATLSGTLVISRSTAYLPTVGEVLPVITFNSRNGEFAAVEGTAIDAGRAFQVRYDDAGKRVVLDVVAVSGVTAANSAADVAPVTEESTGGALFLPLISGSAAQPAEEQTPVQEETNEPLGWNGGAGDGLWRNEGNWSTRQLPTTADSIDLAAAVVRVDSAAAVGALSHGGELILDGGALNVGADYTQNGTLTLVLDGGVDPLLAVAGRANLAGPLNVTPAAGFDPAIGERFTVMVYGERVGEFANGEVVLGSGKRLLVVYNDVAGVVVLEVAPAAPATLKRSTSPDVMALIEAGRLSVQALQSGVDSLLSGESRPIPWLVTAIRQFFLPQMQR